MASGRSIVADAMIHTPRTNGPAMTVAEAGELFRDDHLHALLIVAGPRLVAVVERPDLTGAPPDEPAWTVGRLRGRVVEPVADLHATAQLMRSEPRRRLAVVDDGRLVGLLCLKRTGLGFCRDTDVLARAAERQHLATAAPAWCAPRSARSPNCSA